MAHDRLLADNDDVDDDDVGNADEGRDDNDDDLNHGDDDDDIVYLIFHSAGNHLKQEASSSWIGCNFIISIGASFQLGGVLGLSPHLHFFC